MQHVNYKLKITTNSDRNGEVFFSFCSFILGYPIKCVYRAEATGRYLCWYMGVAMDTLPKISLFCELR